MIGCPFDMTRSKTTNRRQFLSAAAATAVVMPASLSKGFAVFGDSHFLDEAPAAPGAAASVVSEGTIEFESSDDNTGGWISLGQGSRRWLTPERTDRSGSGTKRHFREETRFACATFRTRAPERSFSVSDLEP